MCRHWAQEWAANGLKKFAVNGEYLEAYAAVNQLMNVNDKCSYRPLDPADREGHDDDPDFVVNGVNHYLWRAAKADGRQPERISRNVKKCVDCGNCMFGCPYGSKQSTVTGEVSAESSNHQIIVCAATTVHNLFAVLAVLQLCWSLYKRSSTTRPLLPVRTMTPRMTPAPLLPRRRAASLSFLIATRRGFCSARVKLLGWRALLRSMTRLTLVLSASLL
jgi:ferredoxin